ncbi:MAG: hypothetical protein QOE46_1238 [Acidobacteriota bacterium]|jgi:hypothetical protein|nr:hypothetical protein [Acidobacteriota bacterium]
MAKRDRKHASNKARRLGRGVGRGADYKPLLFVQDYSGKGLGTRIWGWKSAREHHLFSKLELSAFYMLEWADTVVDIRERFPLDQEETRAIAELLGIPHPNDPITGGTMTTNFLVTVQRGLETIDYARTIMYAESLAKNGVLERLEIERAYWVRRDIEWGVITEREIDETLVKNVEWLHRCRDVRNIAPLTADTIRRVETTLAPRVTASALPLRDLTAECDDLLGLEPGSALTVVRHLLANRQWQVDMMRPINPATPLVVTGFASSHKGLRLAGGAA